MQFILMHSVTSDACGNCAANKQRSQQARPKFLFRYFVEHRAAECCANINHWPRFQSVPETRPTKETRRPAQPLNRPTASGVLIEIPSVGEPR
jgi:hypothetical protein